MKTETEFMDYKDFKNLLESAKPTHLYEELVQKEDRILQTVNRVVDYSNKKELESKEFLNMSVKDAAGGFMSSILSIFEELVKAQTYSDVVPVFMKTDRIIYIGILIVLASVVVYFVDIA